MPFSCRAASSSSALRLRLTAALSASSSAAGTCAAGAGKSGKAAPAEHGWHPMATRQRTDTRRGVCMPLPHLQAQGEAAAPPLRPTRRRRRRQRRRRCAPARAAALARPPVVPPSIGTTGAASNRAPLPASGHPVCAPGEGRERREGRVGGVAAGAARSCPLWLRGEHANTTDRDNSCLPPIPPPPCHLPLSQPPPGAAPLTSNGSPIFDAKRSTVKEPSGSAMPRACAAPGSADTSTGLHADDRA